MTIEELELVPDAVPNQDIADKGLMPCWMTLTCYYIASDMTDWY